MIFHENRLPADDSHEISSLICYFCKSGKIWNCRLLQIIGGALRVKVQTGMCVQWRCESICIFTQSDQSLSFPPDEKLAIGNPWIAHWRLWSDCADAQADLGLRLGAHANLYLLLDTCSFDRFVATDSHLGPDINAIYAKSWKESHSYLTWFCTPKEPNTTQFLQGTILYLLCTGVFA